MVLTAVVVFFGGTVWTIVYSFTNSKLLPRTKWVGFDQYERLWNTNRWLISIENLLIYGVLSVIFSRSAGRASTSIPSTMPISSSTASLSPGYGRAPGSSCA